MHVVNAAHTVTETERALFRDPGETGICFLPGRGEGTHVGYKDLLPLVRGAAAGLRAWREGVGSA